MDVSTSVDFCIHIYEEIFPRILKDSRWTKVHAII